MGGVDRLSNIGGHVIVKKGVKTTNAAASATITGVGIDRLDYESMVFTVQCGDAAGSPTAQTVDCKLQHSTALSTGYADVSGATCTQLTADDGLSEKDWDLTGLNRYVRLIVTVALTAGSTPTIPVAAHMIFGGGRSEPI